MTKPPVIKDDPLYRLLRDSKIEQFNREIAAGKKCDLTHADFRGLDLRGLIPDGLDLSNGYFRQADLRGIDFSKAKLDGASIHGAKVAGACFPKELAADEILLSLMQGTRMRYK